VPIAPDASLSSWRESLAIFPIACQNQDTKLNMPPKTRNSIPKKNPVQTQVETRSGSGSGVGTVPTNVVLPDSTGSSSSSSSSSGGVPSQLALAAMQEQIRALSRQVASNPPVPLSSASTSAGSSSSSSLSESSSSSSSGGPPPQALVEAMQDQIRQLRHQLASSAPAAPAQLGYAPPPPRPVTTDPALMRMLARMECWRGWKARCCSPNS
jgi:hypothetical protein